MQGFERVSSLYVPGNVNSHNSRAAEARRNRSGVCPEQRRADRDYDERRLCRKYRRYCGYNITIQSEQSRKFFSASKHGRLWRKPQFSSSLSYLTLNCREAIICHLFFSIKVASWAPVLEPANEGKRVKILARSRHREAIADCGLWSAD